MAEGIKLLRKLQLGREATAGTAVAATTIWRGEGVLEDQRETVFPPEDVGYISGVDRTYVPKLGGALSIVSTPATFEQLPHLFEMGIMTASPAQDSTGSGYVYDYTAPTTAVTTPKFYTIEGGDNIAVEEMEYCFVEKLTLEGKGGEALMMSADIKGRQISTSAFTTTATLPAVEEILFGKGKLYIDAVSGTPGTTQVSNSFMEMSMEYTTGLMAQFTADGQIYFSFVKCVQPEIVLDITFEHNASSVAEIAAKNAQTPRLLQLNFAGAALQTAGAYTTKVLKMVLAGKWEKFSPLGEQDGNDIVTGTFRARYNATAAKFANFTVVNELTTLP